MAAVSAGSAGSIGTLAACGGDDNGDGGMDVTPPDGCTGHLCGSTAAITDPEGGNLIFEYIYVDSELQAAFGLPTGVDTITRVMAYFMDAQDPQSNPLPTPGQCNNLEATKGWPLHVGATHTDLDIGALTITGKNTAGTAVTIDVPKKPAGIDSIGRPHDIFYQTITPDASASLAFNSLYTVNMSGAGSVPASSLTDGLFLSQKFNISAPDKEDNGPLVAGTPLTVHWTPVDSTNLPAGDEVLGVTWLLDSNGSPTHICPVLQSAGQFTIPGSVIAEYKQIAVARGTNPNKVILSRQAITHKISRLPNGSTTNLRRIDVLGIVCWVQLMDVQ